MVLSARRGQCGQGMTSIGRVLYMERLTTGSMATAQFFCDSPSKSLCQACWAANLSRRGEFHSVCPEMGCTFLKHIKPGISFNFFHYKILNSINFYAWTIIWILYLYKLFFKIVWMWIDISGLKIVDCTEICKKKIVYFLTVATIWGVMLTKRRWAPKKFLKN